jgi:hypothetical protein
MYTTYGPEINELLDLDDFLYSCLSKYLEPTDVQSWFCSVLVKKCFVWDYLASRGMDPFVKETQDKAIDFMVRQINKNIILVLQSTHDPFRAFDKYGDKGLFSIFKSVESCYTLHYYISSLKDVEKIMDMLPNGKIVHLVFMAHGTPDAIELAIENISIKDDTINTFGKLLQPKLHTGASILLHSCSVGSGGRKSINFANTLSILLPTHKIYAAERPIARGDLLVTRFQIKPNGDIISQYQIDNQKVKQTHREPYRILEFLK